MNYINKKRLFKKTATFLLSMFLILCTVIQSGSFITPVAAFDEGLNFRVGLVYGKSVKKAIAISSTDTYVMGFQSLLDETKSFTELGTFPAGKIYVTVDGYDWNGQRTRGYNLQIPTKYSTYSAAYAIVEKLRSSVSGYSLYVAYLNGHYCVRVGDFASAANAEKNLSTVQSMIGSSYTLEIMEPNSRIISVYNPSGYVIMEYMSTSYNLGLKVKSGYLTYNNKTYDGVLAFKRYTTSDYDGVQLVSVLPIERYVMCVIPNEVMLSWPTETLKAFAVTVRSYALAGLNDNHNSYNFDLSSVAQVYGMASNLDDKTYGPKAINAVKDTEGLVMAYNGKVCEAFYSSSTGGVTVGSGDAYVTDLPYLKAVKTPWEDYASTSRTLKTPNGKWTVEMTGEKLLTNIKAYGYAWLKGSSIKTITINSYGTDSTYVKSVTVTDNLGNTATLNGSDVIRTRFGLNSANFVVGKGSVTYSYDKITTLGATPYDGNYPAFNLTDFNVITAAGTILSRFSNSLKIQTGSGVVSAPSPKANVITGKDTSNGHTVYTVETVTEKVTGASSNFIFAGKGHGHGVGLSQYGIYDMGRFGYTYDEMVHAYYTDTSIVKYSTLGIK